MVVEYLLKKVVRLFAELILCASALMFPQAERSGKQDFGGQTAKAKPLTQDALGVFDGCARLMIQRYLGVISRFSRIFCSSFF